MPAAYTGAGNDVQSSLGTAGHLCGMEQDEGAAHRAKLAFHRRYSEFVEAGGFCSSRDASNCSFAEIFATAVLFFESFLCTPAIFEQALHDAGCRGASGSASRCLG